MTKLISSFAAICVAVCVSPLHASILNGGFETGDFSNWQTIGVTSVETSAFGTNPSQGTYHGLMQTGDANSGSPAPGQSHDIISTFLGLGSNVLDTVIQNNSNNTASSNGGQDGSAIKQTVTVAAGDTITFEYNMLTTDAGNGQFNDIAFVSLKDANDVNPGTTGDVAILTDLASGTFGGSGASPYNAETGYNTVTINFSSAGTWILGLGVINVNDDNFSSGLLIDGANHSNGGGGGPNNPVPEPGSIAIWSIAGLAGLGLIRARRRKLVAKA